jgi:hypothetical protein
MGFQNGFILDGIKGCALPPFHPHQSLLDLNGNFSKIPPVVVARLRQTR